MKKWVYILLAGLFVMAGIGISYYYYVIDNYRQEQHEALATAANEYSLTNVQDIEHYYGSFGSFQVIHGNVDGDEKFVFVPVKNGEERIVDAEEGWNKKQVKQYVQDELHPDQLVSIHLGLEKFTKESNFIPVWEIVYKNGDDTYTFHYIRYTDGSFFKEYRMNQSA